MAEAACTPMQFHQAVHQGLAQCVASRYSDSAAVDKVVDALDGWVSEYPTQSRDIELLALSACYTALRFSAATAAARIGETGQLASLISPKVTPIEHAASVLLMLLTAEAEVDSGRLRHAQTSLDDARLGLENGKAIGRFAPYLSMRLAFLDGCLAEEALDNARAAPRYAAAADIAQPILGNKALLRTLAGQWSKLVFGKGLELHEDADAKATEMFLSDVRGTYLKAAIRYARTGDDAAAARRAVDACIALGLPRDMSPIELRPVLLQLQSDDIDPRYDELLDRALEVESESRRAAWRVIVALAHGRIHARSGDSNAWDTAHAATSELMSSVHDAPTWATALADMIEEREPVEDAIATFLPVYATCVDGPRHGVLPLPHRVQFDTALSRAVALAASDYAAFPSDTTGSQLSVLLDALHAPDAHALSFVSRRGLEDDDREGLSRSAYETALNRIGRLEYAMVARGASCALLMQTIGDRVCFMLATGDPDNPFIQADAGPEYLEAARALSSGLSDAIHDPSVDTTDVFAALGGAAFDAIPGEIRRGIGDRSTLYIVPDYWANNESVPFELLHDGTDFLCLKMVVARSMSLADLLRTAEEPVVQSDTGSRAVCVGAPEARGEKRLEFAEAEASMARRFLTEWAWDAPEISSKNLEPDRLLDAMEFAGITHIAAHGKVTAGSDAVVLDGDVALTVEDIEARPRLINGLIFLNACSLGRTRYLGAGVNHGISAALLRAGSPCVVANLLPVEDRSAMELARYFYNEIDTNDAGQSLLSARAKLSAAYPPSRWGTTILLGDPQFDLSDGSRSGLPEDAAAALLYRGSVPNGSDEDTTGDAILQDDEVENVRLDGALQWRYLAAELDSDSSIEELLDVARVARALDSRPGEALFLHAAAWLIQDQDERREVLDRTIWSLKPLSSMNPVWNQMHLEALAERKTLDSRGEIEAIDTGSMIVNDLTDPTVRAVLQIQNAVDQQQVEEHGALRLRRPERSLEDIAWNAIVVGQQNRFDSRDSQTGFAIQIAAKLDALALIPSTATDGIRRILAALLGFHWEMQRKTHLEPERAIGQSNALVIALQQFAEHTPDGVLDVMSPIADAIEGLEPTEEDGADKFQNALDALTSGRAPTESPAGLERSIRQGLERCKQESPELQAGAAAWIVGTILLQAHAALRQNPPALADQQKFLDLHRSIYSDLEGWFWPYLMDGYKEVREQQFDFVQKWKWDRGIQTDEAQAP